MNGSWLGRQNWLWLADGVLIAAGIALLVGGNDVTRILAVFIIGSRVLLAGIQVLVWKRSQAAAGPRRDRVTPPR